VLFLRPSGAVVQALSLRVASKAPCVAACATRCRGSTGAAVDASGVSDQQRHDVRLRWVAHRLRQRYARNAGVGAACTANDLLFAAVAVSMMLRAAALCASLAAAVAEAAAAGAGAAAGR
jgi:hypothetical protein